MQLPSIDQLKRALHLSETIESLQKEMSSLFGTAGAKALGLLETGLKRATKGVHSIQVKKKRRRMSASHRAAIVKAQKRRWAKVKGKKVVAKVKRKKGKMSAAGRAAIVKAQKKRWAKVKREKSKAVKPKAKKRGKAKAAAVVAAPQAAL